MSHFQSKPDFFLTKRNEESLRGSQHSVSRSPDHLHELESSIKQEIEWDDKPKIKFFERFGQADELLDEGDLHDRKSKILKRIKTNDFYRKNLRLEGYRSRKKVQIIEQKNLKLQSMINIQFLFYTFLIFLSFKEKMGNLKMNSFSLN
jgi:hypothetical protein